MIVNFFIFWSITSPLAYIFITRKFDPEFKEILILDSKWIAKLPGTAWALRTMMYCSLCIRRKPKKTNRYVDSKGL